jgi:hypothetical protein
MRGPSGKGKGSKGRGPGAPGSGRPGARHLPAPVPRLRSSPRGVTSEAWRPSRTRWTPARAPARFPCASTIGASAAWPAVIGARCRRGRGRRLQGARQPRRGALRAVGLRGGRAVRPGREEAVLPRVARRAGLQLRHARLRPALRVLPELGDVAGAARSPGGCAAAERDARGARRAGRSIRARASSWSAPTTSRSSPSSGRWPCSKRRAGTAS